MISISKFDLTFFVVSKKIIINDMLNDLNEYKHK